MVAWAFLIACTVSSLTGFSAQPSTDDSNRGQLVWEADTGKITSPCLLAAYEEMMRVTRPLSTPEPTATVREKLQWQEYQDLRSRENGTDWECLREGANAALDESPPNWDAYRAAILVAKVVPFNEEYAKSGMVRVCRRALQGPRGEKMSDAQGRAVTDTLEFLGGCYGDDSAKLLRECVRLEFWGDAPMRSRITGTETEKSLIMVRTTAIRQLGRLGDKGLPFLMELQKEYPYTMPVTVPSSEYRFEMGAGHIIKRCIDEIKSRPTM